MLITDERLARLKAAGYTWYIAYDKFLPICELWTRTGFPTCDESLQMHKDSLESGHMDDIRNVEFIQL